MMFDKIHEINQRGSMKLLAMLIQGILSICLLLNLLVAQTIPSQENSIFRIEQFKKDGGIESYIAVLDSMIPIKLAEHPYWKDFGIQTKVRGFGDVGDDAYYLSGRIHERYQQIHVKGKVHFGELQFAIKAVLTIDKGWRDRSKEEQADTLAERLMNAIYVGLVNGVDIFRVQVDSIFSWQGGDNKYQYLGRFIAEMLKDGFRSAPQITLIEKEGGESVEIGRIQDTKDQSEHDLYKRLKTGILVFPDYRISGFFGELKNQLSIRTQCQLLKTKTIISNRGVSLNADTAGFTDIENAARLLATYIDNDIYRRKYLLYSPAEPPLGVVGISPVPNTDDNRIRTSYIVKALTRKLQSINNGKIEIKDSGDHINYFLNNNIDKWHMLAALDVRYLLIIEYQDDGKGYFRIQTQLFDSKNPSANIYNESKISSSHKIGTTIDAIVKEIALKLNIDNNKTSYKETTVLRITRPSSFEFFAGRIWTNDSGPLEYSENSSFSVSVFFPLSLGVRPFGIPFDEDHFKIGTIAAWDWGDNTLENVFRDDVDHSVHLISSFVAFKYNLWPNRGFNMYFGVGGGVLWLRRILGVGFDMLHAPGDLQIGFTEIAGAEFRLSQKWRLCIPVKHFFGTVQFEEKIHDNCYFNGGVPYGFNYGLGFSYSW